MPLDTAATYGAPTRSASADSLTSLFDDEEVRELMRGELADIIDVSSSDGKGEEFASVHPAVFEWDSADPVADPMRIAFRVVVDEESDSEELRLALDHEAATS